MLHQLWILNRHGTLIYQREFLKRGTRPLSSNDQIRLASTLHGLCRIAAEVSPIEIPRNTLDVLKARGINRLDTDTFTMFVLESKSGVRVVLISDPGMSPGRAELFLGTVYELFGDYVLKDPFYESIDMPVRCKLFDHYVGQIVV